jgi:diketogulonate reductase-like aldo/keto reductase
MKTNPKPHKSKNIKTRSNQPISQKSNSTNQNPRTNWMMTSSSKRALLTHQSTTKCTPIPKTNHKRSFNKKFNVFRIDLSPKNSQSNLQLLKSHVKSLTCIVLDVSLVSRSSQSFTQSGNP